VIWWGFLRLGVHPDLIFSHVYPGTVLRYPVPLVNSNEDTMARSLSWFAISGAEPGALLDELQLARTGVTAAHPEQGIFAASLPDGAFLLYVDDVRSYLTAPSLLKALSSKGRLIACRADKQVMSSTVACYHQGELAWSVAHHARESLFHLAVVGEAPAQLAALQASAMAAQESDDCCDADTDHLFDVPIRLAEALTSFHRVTGLRAPRADAFELLQTLQPPPGKPWWKLW
jgi:hypothetical protein